MSTLKGDMTMSKKLYSTLAILAILALALSACANPTAKTEGVWYFPWTWGDKTLDQTLGEMCVLGGQSAIVNGVTYPCPNASTTAGGDTTTQGNAPATTGLTATKQAEFNGVSTTVVGPAIAQLWDGKSKNGCNIVKVPKGKSLTWSGQGHWWMYEGADEAAFNAEWEASQQAYKNNSPQCTGNFTANVK